MEKKFSEMKKKYLECRDTGSPFKDLEAEISSYCRQVIPEMNQEKKKIVALLEEYRTLCERMADVENLFLSHVVVSGNLLKMTIEKREFLEKEYERILENYKWGVYSSLEKIEKDVQQILHRAETLFVTEEREKIEAGPGLPFVTPVEYEKESGDLFDETRKKEILNEFKKTVIPSVHADTSDTPFDVFSFVLEVYKKRNHLLMLALVIRYRDELSWPSESRAIPEFLEVIERNSSEYPLVSMALTDKIDRMRQKMSTKEVESSEVVKDQLKQQNKEISKAINEEAERILVLMKKLDDLCEGNLPEDEDKKS